MSARPAWALAVLLAALPLEAAAPPPAELVLGRFGRVLLHRPPAEPVQVALFATADDPKSPATGAVVREATAQGALVIEFDTRAYLAAAGAAKASCLYAAADLEALSQRVQKQLGLPVYRPPVLLGSSSGGTLVQAAFAEAPPNTFRGAISLGSLSALKTTRPLCAGHGVPRGAIEISTEAGGDPAGEPAWIPRFRAAWGQIAAPLPVAPPPAAVADLPLIEVPLARPAAAPAAAPSSDSTLAVILSGDGGWAGLDKELAGALSERGIPTVGWNTLSYFWTARSPEGMSHDLARVLRHYQAAWRRDRVLLIGYSFGADVLPFMASRLPPDLAGRVAGVALLGPSRETGFEFHVSNWLGALAGGSDDEHPVLPEVRTLAARLPGIPLLCLYGEKETDTICPEIRPPLGKTIPFAGAHHFGGNYGDVADRLIAEFAPRPGAVSPAGPAPK